VKENAGVKDPEFNWEEIGI